MKNTSKTQNIINPVREHLKRLALAVAVAVGLGSGSVLAATLIWAVAGNGAWDDITAGVNDGPLDDPDHDSIPNLLEWLISRKVPAGPVP